MKKFREATAIMMSCKRSIKANHHLSDDEARALIEDLSNCENPYNCPHGRPTLVQLTNLEIERCLNAFKIDKGAYSYDKPKRQKRVASKIN